MAVLLCACKPTVSGGSTLPFDPVKIIAECESLADGGERSLTSRDTLPPLIKSLKPQAVTVQTTETPPATIVNIQMLGGFQHQGYIIIVTNRGADFIPSAGRDWRVTKIAPGIFEYRE